jgi:ketosteroid isomerase-like protein
MSRENVEIVRRSFDAFARDGIDGLLRYLDPGIEWTTTGAFLEADTYRGPEDVRRYLGSLLDEFEDVRNEPEELIDAGDQIVASVRISGRGKQSGAAVDLTMTQVCLLREGRIVRIQNYMSRSEALEAAGLSD